jgi:hypothetical protein
LRIFSITDRLLEASIVFVTPVVLVTVRADTKNPCARGSALGAPYGPHGH